MGSGDGARAEPSAGASEKRTYGSTPGFVTKAKKGVDGLNGPPYMPLTAAGTAQPGRSSLRVSLSRTTGARNHKDREENASAL